MLVEENPEKPMANIVSAIALALLRKVRFFDIVMGGWVAVWGENESISWKRMRIRVVEQKSATKAWRFSF